MPSNSISVSIPASYWYLQNFPVYEMQNWINYFVYTNYDYFGQWDYGKQGIGCHINETYTENRH